MTFNPKQLPPTVYDIYKLGPIGWIFVVQTAIQLKITNINELTNIAFHLHHPELKGRSLQIGETQLIGQWKGFRALIKPLIPVWGKSSASRTNNPDSDGFADIIVASGPGATSASYIQEWAKTQELRSGK